MSETAERETIYLTYVGSRIGIGDKLIDLWLETTKEQYENGECPDLDEMQGCYRVYKGKDVLRHLGGVGNVYEVFQTKGTTSIYSREAKYVGRWGSDEQRLKWQIKHREAITTIDLQKKASKESKNEFEPLQPFRERYQRLVNRNQKAALLAQLIAFVTG